MLFRDFSCSFHINYPKNQCTRNIKSYDNYCKEDPCDIDIILCNNGRLSLDKSNMFCIQTNIHTILNPIRQTGCKNGDFDKKQQNDGK